MKNLFHGVGVVTNVVLFSAAASAQQTPPRILSQQQSFDMLSTFSAASGLETVMGKPGVLVLKAGGYDLKDVLETLAFKSGGKAIFTDGFQTNQIRLLTPLQGTVPELIKSVARYGVVAGQLGFDWVFVPVEKVVEKPIAPSRSFIWTVPSGGSIFIPGVLPNGSTLRILPQPAAPPTSDFNLNPTPGQNLPPTAKPFEFNAKRFYQVPLQPK